MSGIYLPRFKIGNFRIRNISVDILLFLHYFLLLMAYPFIAKKYIYWGFSIKYNIYTLLIGFIFLYLGFQFKKIIKDDFLNIIYSFFLILFFIPQIVYYQSASLTIKPVVANFLFLIIFACSSYLVIKYKFVSIPITLNYNFIIFIILTIILIVPFIYFYAPYINLRNIFLADVYETRLKFRDIKVDLLAYLINPLTRIFLPIILVVSILRKQYFLSFTAILGIIFLFLCGAFKSYFFGLIAVILFINGDYYKKLKIFLLIILAFCSIGVVIAHITGNIMLLDLFTRRIFFLPPFLDNHYYNLFNHNFTFWSHNPIGSLFSRSHFDKPIPIAIGEIIFKKEGVNANVGVITEGFISLGFIGVIIHSFILSLIFIFIKELRLHPSFFGIVFIFIFVALNSFLTIMFTTHGLLFLIIIALLFLRNSDKNLI